MLRLLVNSLLFLLLSISVFSQEQKLEISNFAGLNTRSGDLSVQPNEARVAHNIDWSRNLQSITKRFGYDSVSVLVGMDSIVAIFPATYSDGSKQLIIIADSAGVGYGAIYATALGSFSLTSGLTKIWDNYPITNMVSFAMSNDAVFIANGLQKTIVYVENIARSFPVSSPGEPTIIPLSISGGLDGEYFYAFEAILHNSGSTVIDTMYTFNVTSPVKINNKQVLMRDFWWIANDSLNNVDSMSILIYRNKRSQRRIKNGDQLYLVDSIPLNDSTGYSTVQFIDSLADSELTDSITFSPNNFYGRDSTKVLTSRYYNSPGFNRSDSTIVGLNMFAGYPENATDTVGFAYVVTLVDTITGIESNASAPFVYNVATNNGASLLDSIRINLPPLRSNDSGYFYNIYRASVFRTQLDSSYLEDLIVESTGGNCILESSYPDGCDRDPNCTVVSIKPNLWKVCRQGDDLLDTVNVWTTIIVNDNKQLGTYQFLAQYPSDSDTFMDGFSSEELQINPLVHHYYEGSSAPVLLNNLFSFQGRMWGTFKSRLYWSDINNPFSWGALQFVDINPNDGDVITSAWVSRTAIRIFKNNSSHNVYPGDDNLTYFDWSRTEVSSYFGSIAPNSHAAGAGGHYYLSNIGVIHETEGMELKRTFIPILVSEKLDNFDKISLTDKQNSVGFYFDRKYFLSVPNDTTYVYDERTQGWATWSLTFKDAALFNTANGSYSDSMYFVDGDSLLYRYGGVEFDKLVTTVPQIIWQSAPMLVDDFTNKITAVGLWTTENVSGTDSLFVQVRNESGIKVSQFAITDFTKRYNEFGIEGKKANYLQLIIGTTTGLNINISIDKITVFHVNEGKLERK